MAGLPVTAVREIRNQMIVRNMNFLDQHDHPFLKHVAPALVFVEQGQGPYANTRAALAHFDL